VLQQLQHAAAHPNPTVLLQRDRRREALARHVEGSIRRPHVANGHRPRLDGELRMVPGNVRIAERNVPCIPPDSIVANGESPLFRAAIRKLNPHSRNAHPIKFLSGEPDCTPMRPTNSYIGPVFTVASPVSQGATRALSNADITPEPLSTPTC
jgi:hypothetical protein